MGIQDHPAYKGYLKRLGAGHFRKRPLLVTAIQWTGDNFNEVERFTAYDAWCRKGPPDLELGLVTLEGTVSVSVGDWIIKGVKGEHYPCKPDVFELTYEVAE